MIEIYTDGACIGNPGPGGWAAIVVQDGRKAAHSGRPRGRTTNQRMEVQAAIEGLSRTDPGARITVFSDSQYLVNTMSKGWKRNANKDLWAKLDRLVGQSMASISLGRSSSPVLCRGGLTISSYRDWTLDKMNGISN